MKACVPGKNYSVPEKIESLKEEGCFGTGYSSSNKYILGRGLHRSYYFGTSYSTTGKQYITIDGQVIAQSVLQALDYPMMKTNGRVTLPPMSVSIIKVKIPKLTNTTDLYKVNADTFQLPESIILLDILHRVDHKTLQHLNVPVLNANIVSCSIGKNMQGKKTLLSLTPCRKM